MADVVDTKAAYDDEGEEKAFVHKHSAVELPREITDPKLKFWLQSEGLLFLQNELYCLKYTDLCTITTDEIDLLSQNLEHAQKIRFRNAVNNLKSHYSVKSAASTAKPVPTTYKEIFKVILVGQCNVGKSNILSRFVKDEFEMTYKTTVGLEREDQIIETPQKNVKLQIFDTSGSHEFGTISKAFFRQTHGVFIVYDVTNQQSFDNITNLIEKLKMQVDQPNDEKKAWKILIANKCDLQNQRVITKQQGQELADQHQIKFMECSAKTGDNIDSMFGVMAQYLLEVWDESATSNKMGCCCVLL